MSRAKIGGVVAVVVVVLTGAAYFLTTKKLESQIREDVNLRVRKGQQFLDQTAKLETLDIIARTKGLAEDKRLPAVFGAADLAGRTEQAGPVFRDFLAKKEVAKPDFIAIVNERSEVVVMDVPLNAPEDWSGRKAVVDAIHEGIASKDIWEFRGGLMKVGVAPIGDPAQGAVVVAYAVNAKEAAAQSDLLGMEVAYFMGDRVRATSFGSGSETDVNDLSKVLADEELGKEAIEQGKTNVAAVRIHGEEYVVTAVRLPLNYDNKATGAMVIMSLTKALEPIGVVKLTILLLGLGALLVASLAMLITARLILNPAEEIELGVTEIINGNIDYTFKPAGADFDGLANALNVMLARLLGRPEPGEDGLDEAGGSVGGKVTLEEADVPSGPSAAALGGAATASDPETLALAHEPEPDYYRRIYGEYIAARKGLGEKVDGVTFEGFVAKLRLNEANLKKKYGSRAVRFRVQARDGQVTLKPVPIL
jgi:hypothetical protein